MVCGKRKKNGIKKRLEGFHWNSVTVLISLVTAVIAIASVVLAFVVLEYYFDDAAVQISIQSNEQTVKNIRKSIDSYMDEMLMIAERTQELFQRQVESDGIKQIEFVIREDIDTIAVFRADGELLMKSDNRSIKEQVDIPTETWFQEALEADGEVIFTAPHVQRLYKGEYPWVISMAKKINCRGQEGVILVDMNFENIKKLCTPKDISEGEIYILDEEGKVIYHPNQQMLYAGIRDGSMSYAMEMTNETKAVTFEGTKHIISSYLMDSNGWQIVIVNEMKWLELLIDKIKYSAVRLMLLILAFAICAAVVSAIFIIRPLKKLMKLMQTAQNGDFSVRASERGYYEVAELTRSFNSMVNQISKLLADIKTEHELLRKSEMKTLHEQINSHFLYNTLDSVIWMAEVDDKENSIKMLKALSQFFRLSLSSGKEIIPVEAEVKHVENYLIIQKMRYADIIEYSIVVEPEVRFMETLKMVLQPIVENSILHGMKECQGDGRIEIVCGKKEEKLLMTVRDNGCGIPGEKMKHILEIDASNKNGVGIKNVNERIQMMFGKEYGLHFESYPDEGTIVEIWLPLYAKEKMGNEKYS